MSRPRLLAVTGLAPWPVRGGFALRAAGLLEGLAETWDIDLVVGAEVDRTAGGGSMRNIVAVPGAAPWRPVPSRRADHAPLRAAVDRAISERTPDAVLLFNGAEFLAFDRPDFPPAIADRIDCGTLERGRYVRYARNLRGFKALFEAGIERAYERRVVRRFEVTTAVGEDDAEALRRIGGRDAVTVVVNGVETLDGPAFDREGDRPTVLFSGTLSYYANADAVRYFVRRIWPRVRAAVPDARFVAAGRTPGRGIRALASRAGVEIRPDVPDMTSVIQESWVTVAPMRCGAGVKNKVLEAWAAGRPAVVTPIGANGLHLDEPARRLVAAHPVELAARVVELLRDADARHAYGVAAQEVARARHTWADSAARMSDLLKSLPG